MASRSQSAFSRADRASSAYSCRPYSAPSPGRNSNRYLNSIQTFLTGPAADVLRVRLRQAANFRNLPLTTFLRNNYIAIINALSRQKGLIQVVFPQDKRQTPIDRWGTQLLCTILRSSGCLALQEESDVALLEKCYKRHYRMRPLSTSAKRLRPKREWIQVCSAVQRLVENTGDPVLIKTVRNFICQVEMGAKKVQAHQDMQHSLYETLMELISTNPDSKYTVKDANGKIIEKEMKKLAKLKQTYEDLSARSTVSWTKETSFEESKKSKPRVLSSVSFKSPYETKDKWKGKESKSTPRNTDILRVKKMESCETGGRVSPYAGKDITARVAYLRALPQPKPVQEYRLSNGRPYSAKETKLPDVNKPDSASSNRKQTSSGKGNRSDLKRTLPNDNNKFTGPTKTQISSVPHNNNQPVAASAPGNDASGKTKFKTIKDLITSKLSRRYETEHNGNSSVKQTAITRDKIKRSKSNLKTVGKRKSYRVPSLRKSNKLNTSARIPETESGDINSVKESNKKETMGKINSLESKQNIKKIVTIKSENVKNKHQKKGKFNTSKSKTTRLQPLKTKNRQQEKNGVRKNDPNENFPITINLDNIEDTLVTKHSGEINDTDVTNNSKADVGQIDTNIQGNPKSNPETPNDELTTSKDKLEREKTQIINHETDLNEIFDSDEEQKKKDSQKLDVENIFSADEKEMRKVAMEVLVHQNVRSVVSHPLFQSKNSIDKFFDFLYKNRIVKKFLKSLNSQPYKNWDHVEGKTDYFYFLHCFIFRHIDPNKDEAALYTVEKILTRMQCKHLRTPRPKTSMGSMFKNRKSVLMEALEYSRSNTQPNMRIKPPTGSRSNSPQTLSKSYTASESSPRPKSYLPLSSRSLSTTPRLPAPSSRCWKCKQKDLAMKICINWGNKCICDLLLKEGVHYKMEHLLPAVKINSLWLLSDIVNHLKERQDWDCEDRYAKDALHEAKKLKMIKMIDFLEAEGIEDDRQVRKVCITCLF